MKKTVWQATDGKIFDNKVEHDKHEDGLMLQRLVGQTVETLSRPSQQLSDALEWAGNRAANTRRASGSFRRVQKQAAE